jgi:glutamate-1-semialdehyde 2,1-aminomutase/spore coat polysaccharide biosynthesis protein SpsF
VVAIIVQARLASTRLPGKVLLPLRGASVLAHVLRRCAAVPGVNTLCCAIPDLPGHEALAVEAQCAGAIVIRGPEQDVLERYRKAAAEVDADIIMRVTSDCPLIDPAICAAVLQPVIGGEADYACNNFEHTWPHGLDCEAFTRTALERAAQQATDAYDREHVTPWLRRHPNLRRKNIAGPGGWGCEQRWTLDYPEDYAFLQALMELLPQEHIPDTQEVLNMLRQHPEITAINADRVGASRPPAAT